MARPSRPVVMLAVLALLGGALLACGGDDEGPLPGSTPAAGATQAPAATPAVVRPEGVKVEVSRAIDVPRDLAILDNGIDRTYRNAQGATVTERVWDEAFHGVRLVSWWNVHHVGATLPYGQLAMSVCYQGDCGGLQPASSDAFVQIWRSSDGGMTWKASDNLQGVYQVATAIDLNRVLLARMPQDGQPSEPHFEWFPGGERVTPPEGWASDRYPQQLADGRLAWWMLDGRLMDSRDGLLLDLRELSTGAVGVSVLPQLEGDRIAVTWHARDPQGGDETWYWSIFSRDGAEFRLVRTYEAPVAHIPTAWVDNGQLLVNLDLTDGQPVRSGGDARLPAIFNLATAELFPLNIERGSTGLGRRWAVAAQLGPFAYVNPGAEDCLNVRSASSSVAVRLECVAHGTLVRQLGQPSEGWIRVRTPAGAEGWASAEYLISIPTR